MTMVSEPLTVMFDLSAAGVGAEPAPGADLFSSVRVQPRATTAESAKTARGRMLMVGTSVGWSLGWRREGGGDEKRGGEDGVKLGIRGRLFALSLIVIAIAVTVLHRSAVGELRAIVYERTTGDARDELYRAIDQADHVMWVGALVA